MVFKLRVQYVPQFVALGNTLQLSWLLRMHFLLNSISCCVDNATVAINSANMFASLFVVLIFYHY